MRIVLVARPAAPVRGLVARLQDPDLEVVVCASAREALDEINSALPDVAVVDGSLPDRDVSQVYGRLRASPVGARVPIIFSSHDRSGADQAATAAPDFYPGREATLDDLEQLVFTFLPEALFEDADPAGAPEPAPEPIARPIPRRGPPSRAVAGAPQHPDWGNLRERLQGTPWRAALAYLGGYAAAEVLAATFDARLGLVIHAGLLLAMFFHGANVPAGTERTFVWVIWLAPLTRIYGLALPYAGAPPLAWWALTTIPMAVAGFVAMRLTGLAPRDAGLIPRPREAPIAVCMAPVGLALGVLAFLVLEPRSLGRELAFGGAGLVALIAIVNPGIVDEIIFRGVLWRGTVGLFGPVLSVLYTSLLYAPVLPAGLSDGASLSAVFMTFGTGVLFASITAWSGSVLSATVAHAGLALGLFVIAPYLMPNNLAPTVRTPTVPSTAEVRVPTPNPAVIVASPAGGAPVRPGATGLPPSPGQAGQPSPATQPSVPTPVTLAPPLAPPAIVSPGPPTPGSSGAASGQPQAVVVRGTDGSGARLRAQPGTSGQIITVVAEGTPLLVIGADRTADGLVWRNVRAPNGTEGWIAASLVSTGQ